MMTCTCEQLAYTASVLFSEAYPHVEELPFIHIGVEDLSAQLVFEVIKEHYKDKAPRHPIDHYIKEYGLDASNSRFTETVNQTQRYRDDSNDIFESLFGLRLPELEQVDMGGGRRFRGYSITAAEFLGLEFHMECALLKKLHGGQIDRSHNVSEARFKDLFRDYHVRMGKLEPYVSDLESVVSNTLFYFGIETHFLIDFLYGIVLAAERHGFPSEVPTGRIIDICGPEIYVPGSEWCPEVLMADNFMLMKWGALLDDVFEDSDEAWSRKADLLRDCKQLKTRVLQANGKKMVSMISQCDVKEMADYITDNYFVWALRPEEYEWTSDRIRYFRKLHPLVVRVFEK